MPSPVDSPLMCVMVMMCQKVFSMQMSSAVGIKIEDPYRKVERGIPQTSKEDDRWLLLETKIGVISLKTGQNYWD